MHVRCSHVAPVGIQALCAPIDWEMAKAAQARGAAAKLGGEETLKMFLPMMKKGLTRMSSYSQCCTRWNPGFVCMLTKRLPKQMQLKWLGFAGLPVFADLSGLRNEPPDISTVIATSHPCSTANNMWALRVATYLSLSITKGPSSIPSATSLVALLGSTRHSTEGRGEVTRRPETQDHSAHPPPFDSQPNLRRASSKIYAPKPPASFQSAR
jgi:hypothetical protein